MCSVGPESMTDAPSRPKIFHGKGFAASRRSPHQRARGESPRQNLRSFRPLCWLSPKTSSNCGASCVPAMSTNPWPTALRLFLFLFGCQKVNCARQLLGKVSETIPVLYCPGNHDLGDAGGGVDDESDYVRRCGGGGGGRACTFLPIDASQQMPSGVYFLPPCLPDVM